MVKFVLLAVLACSAISAVLGSSPGISFVEDLTRDGRIIQGAPAAPNQFPHQVNLEMVNSSGGRSRCGGSLISTRWVLTAAHCLINQASVNVRLGSVDFNNPQLLISSSDFTYNEKYNPTTLNNDVGVINLGRDVPVSASIRPIRLPSRSQVSESFADRLSTVSGWGFTNNNGPVSTTMNFVNLNVITNQRCIQDFGPVYIVASNICAAGIKSGAQGVCFGDSGGPLILRESDGQDTQIGVVSFVSGAGCDANYASGFARTSSFVDWIAQKTGITVRP